jgi:hypothetical protein
MQRNWKSTWFAAAAIFCVLASLASAQTNTAPVSPQVPGSHPAPYRKFHAIDADSHNVALNRLGVVTMLVGTNEDSQEGARAAGKAVYTYQGRSDFQLIVVVDLRDSIANWAPSIVTSRMRSSLDEEAVELKPYYLKNGNKSDPRKSSYVIPDFSGTICPQLGWTTTSDNLRGILFAPDGREIERWDNLDDMVKMQTDIHAAIQAAIDSDKAKALAASKSQGTKLIQPPTPHLPLPPLPPPVPSPN